ncbi:MFS transporter [Bradyrhizobium liaoningense]|uniref:MFS transporter n=1 Tax=Bradyrhizobium liaoningense TaxID=43992 RepID=UPI001BAE0D52|nr:MFS transporter [Bradyrhizobium liaoningense]MBR0739792.1 MFS transporter [Bradyrhizobium liaoningense]
MSDQPLTADQIVSAPLLGSSMSRRHGIAAVTIGNTIEYYDFTVYTFFAVMIGRQFFPVDNPWGNLLLSVATFGVGFLTRPLGAIFIGALADRAGRRAALNLSIVLMALGTALIALTPGYATLGLAAPILLVVGRLLQGFAAGGEIGSAASYMIEVAPPAERGYFGSWTNAGQGLALILAGVVAMILTSVLPQAALESWGWRVAFLVGLVIVPVGVYVRRHIPETIDGASVHGSAGAVLKELFGSHLRTVTLGVLTIVGGTVSYFVSTYMTSYAIATLHLPPSAALVVPFVAGVSVVIPTLFGGWLSDRIGRKPVLIWPRVVLILAAYPAFMYLTAQPSALSLALMTAVIMGLHSLSGGLMLVLVPELLPRAVRTTGFAMIYAVGVCVFGGSTQVVLTWLIQATGNPLSPAYYLMLANAISVVAMLMLEESKGRALD